MGWAVQVLEIFSSVMVDLSLTGTVTSTAPSSLRENAVKGMKGERNEKDKNG